MISYLSFYPDRFKLHRLFMIFLLPVLTGCHQSKLENALQLAGTNRFELERVLAYYSQDPSESLKLKAAIFLIENMPGHISYTGPVIDSYYEQTDRILNSNLSPQEKSEQFDLIDAMHPDLRNYVVEDVKIIKADFLIKNIDQAHEDWRGKRMLRHVSFDQFCEFMLPYKIDELQALDCWRDSLRGKYSTRYREAPASNLHASSVWYAAHLINEQINDTFSQYHHQGKSHHFLKASQIDKIAFGECKDFCNLATAILRSEGLPVSKESFPHRGNRPYGHSWFSVLDNNGTLLPFYWGIGSIPGGAFFPDDRIPKVYRNSWSKNPKADRYLKSCRNVPIHVDVFKKDVTAEYTSVSHITIPVLHGYKKAQWAYIAVFDNQDWMVVDFGEIKKGKARFETWDGELLISYSGTMERN